jgi:hypothetical protein
VKTGTRISEGNINNFLTRKNSVISQYQRKADSNHSFFFEGCTGTGSNKGCETAAAQT